MKLPPLVLESKPIPVVDKMKTKQNPAATGSAIAIYALLFLLVGWLLKQHVQFAAPVKTIAAIDISIRRSSAESAGDGWRRWAAWADSGDEGNSAEVRRDADRSAEGSTDVDPKIKIEPTIEVQKDVKMASSIPQIGVANSPILGMSMGNGSGTGLGSGNGSGLGPGSGWQYGWRPRRIGGGVSAPQLIYQVDADFSEEARKAKFSGNVVVNLWVDQNGMPSHVHVVRGVGMGLDEKAVEAVKQYKFKPAMGEWQAGDGRDECGSKLPDLLISNET